MSDKIFVKIQFRIVALDGVPSFETQAKYSKNDHKNNFLE